MNKDKLKKLLVIVITAVGVLLITTGGYAWHSFTSTITNIQEEIDYQANQMRVKNLELGSGEPMSLLLIGVDEPGSNGDFNQRSDTLIYVTLNPKTETTHMVSIPRDTYTEMTGEIIDDEIPDSPALDGEKDKISHSYALGGTSMTVQSVETFLDVRVDYFVKVDMTGLEDIVDAVGRIEVDNSFAFTYKGVTFEEGPNHLNSEETRKYVRMRKDDPRGDFGRQERQRQVIQALMEKGTTLQGLTSSISNFKKILTAIEDNFRTNLDLESMWDIQDNYRDALNNIVEHEIPGEDGEIDETYYYMPDEEKVQELSEELNKQLEE
ncbi:transcriptional attenuator, LytR family [Gracilibacillus orientalis]|uniref:Transcriptional attenuator, LytR family n=1 Tax=Gracilibacillus orientalis TaxID=334253 RepID=A0A1I4LJV4_9BACI|nr:LCP family protein [Gracilibacillus orientalis]SFL91136.1 transcriptional attenuator, LytR family [Gracilibacillus orientalis]